MIRYLSSWGICLIVLQILGISRGSSARLCLVICLSTLPTQMTDGKHIIRLKIANQSTLPNCQRAIRTKTWGWRGGSRKEPRKRQKILDRASKSVTRISWPVTRWNIDSPETNGVTIVNQSKGGTWHRGLRWMWYLFFLKSAKFHTSFLCLSFN